MNMPQPLASRWSKSLAARSAGYNLHVEARSRMTSNALQPAPVRHPCVAPSSARSGTIDLFVRAALQGGLLRLLKVQT